jgi:lysophospholipase L1-like esterase/dienelactone hydrolase
MEKHTVWLATALFILLHTSIVSAQAPIKVACVGNSITAGAGIKDAANNSYPAQLQALLGDKYAVSNFGVSGTTLLKKGNSPYWNTPTYQKALQSGPDIVLIKLGTNDSKKINRGFLGEFKKDLHDLVQSFAQLSTHPRVILLLPVTAFGTDSNSIYDPVIKTRIIPLIQQVAYAESLEVIDLHSLFMDHADLVPDKIHPNAEGAGLIAKRLAQLIKQPRDTTYDLISKINLPKKITSFYGYRYADFTFNGRNCKIVAPKWAAKGHPWVWRARFWGHEPQADIALLEHGFHIVYCDVAELYGNKESISLWNGYYKLMHKNGLAKKVVLEGMSRGGVYLYNWAAENPKKVACVYADNPVLDLKSWPGGLGKGPGSKGDWAKVKVDFNLDSTNIAGFAQSPINKVKQIVKGKYPMLHLLADADEVVPPEENTIPFEQAVKALNGDITVYHKPGFKHHPHSLPNPAVIVDFILQTVKVED